MTIFFLAELGFNCFLPTFLYLPARAVIYRLAGQIHCLLGQGFIQAAKSAAKAPICNRDYNSKGCQNSPRFLTKLSPVFVAGIHCLLWVLVMTNWLVTSHLFYPLPTTNHNIHRRFFSIPGPQFPEFLLPFRKPKRIRTAFSPSQLLKLEHAFEKNQYVVGQERKELAKSLNLSETQVEYFCSIFSSSNYNSLIFSMGVAQMAVY